MCEPDVIPPNCPHPFPHPYAGGRGCSFPDLDTRVNTCGHGSAYRSVAPLGASRVARADWRSERVAVEQSEIKSDWLVGENRQHYGTIKNRGKNFCAGTPLAGKQQKADPDAEREGREHHRLSSRVIDGEYCAYKRRQYRLRHQRNNEPEQVRPAQRRAARQTFVACSVEKCDAALGADRHCKP